MMTKAITKRKIEKTKPSRGGVRREKTDFFLISSAIIAAMSSSKPMGDRPFSAAKPAGGNVSPASSGPPQVRYRPKYEEAGRKMNLEFIYFIIIFFPIFWRNFFIFSDIGIVGTFVIRSLRLPLGNTQGRCLLV